MCAPVPDAGTFVYCEGEALDVPFTALGIFAYCEGKSLVCSVHDAWNFCLLRRQSLVCPSTTPGIFAYCEGESSFLRMAFCCWYLSNDCLMNSIRSYSEALSRKL